MNRFPCKVFAFLFAFGVAAATACATPAAHSAAGATARAAHPIRMLPAPVENLPAPLTADPPVWLEQEVFAGDGSYNDLFGNVVLVSGATAVIGAQSTDSGYGAVYVFTRAQGVWTQTQKLTTSDGYQFGSSLALDGDSLLVGAQETVVSGQPDGPAAVYEFHESNGIWTQAAEILGSAPDGHPYSGFGHSVALSGSTALIGAYCEPYDPVTFQCGPGAALVFSRSGGTWTQVAELGASDGAAHDSFGWSVALSGATALVGSPAAEVNGVSGEGAAYVFTQTGDTWSEAQKLTANNSAGVIHRFGGALALEGSTALIGAPWSAVADNGEFGSAYVFGESGGNWVQTQELVPTDGVTGVSFGDAVALEGASMLIGACDETQTYVGAADVFVNQNGVWSQVQRLAASNGFAWDQFGCAVALDDGTALVGAPGVYGEDLDMGAAYFYGRCELELALSAPQTVSQGQQYISEAIATNNASAASPGVAVTATVPAAASFVSVIASQGSCSEHSGVVNCDFGAIDGNGGTATLNLTLEATGASGSTIENTASIAKATPALTASAATEITGAQSCPDGYSIFTGTLPPNGRTRGPSYEAPAGEENAILYAPAGFRLYGRVDTAHGRRQQGFPGNEVHRWGPAGTYAWGIRAGEAGGAYTICTLHP